MLFGRISGNEKPRYHPYNTDSENNHKSRAPAECQGQVTDDGAGDRAAQRRACAEKADGGSRLLLGNQPLIILFADAQIGPSAIPKSTRSTSME